MGKISKILRLHTTQSTSISRRLNRLTESFAESQEYFSGKNFLRRYENEAVVIPAGIAMIASNHYPRSVHDKASFQKILPKHQNILEKQVSEVSILYVGLITISHEDSWAVQCEKT